VWGAIERQDIALKLLRTPVRRKRRKEEELLDVLLPALLTRGKTRWRRQYLLEHGRTIGRISQSGKGAQRTRREKKKN